MLNFLFGTWEHLEIQGAGTGRQVHTSTPCRAYFPNYNPTRVDLEFFTFSSLVSVQSISSMAGRFVRASKYREKPAPSVANR
jgi:hypothetical protein